MEHKNVKCMLPASDKKGMNDTLNICQLHPFVIGERHVLYMFVLKAVDYNQLFWWNLNKSTLQNTFKESI